jgi:hypothetical protein
MADTLKINNMNPHAKDDIHPLQYDFLPNPKKCFRMIIFAPSHSGKSNLIKNLIMRDEFGYNKWYKKNIFIFSKTLKLDSIWEDLSIPAKHQYDSYDEQLMTNLLSYAERQKNGILIILDDMINDAKLVNKKKSNLLTQLFYQGRHKGISLILVSQKLKDIPSGMRVNASHLICFNLRSRKEEQDFLAENSIENLQEKYKTCTSEKYGFMYMDKESNKQYKNFQAELL